LRKCIRTHYELSWRKVDPRDELRDETEEELMSRTETLIGRREFVVTAAAAGFGAMATRPGACGEEKRGRAISLFNGKTLDGWTEIQNKPAIPPTAGWMVKDGAMASMGQGRGVIYTTGDYGRFRLMFTMRHVSGAPDHQACVLIFCTRPVGDERPLDALGGIQFQVPNGGHWDYRPGKNTDGGAEFTRVVNPQFDPHAWSRVEILADVATGRARMAVAQPPDSKAVEVLDFVDPTAGKAGPIAWQMHNAGLFDEYKDVTIEVDPKVDRLVTVG
jgi:hypothetical protein